MIGWLTVNSNLFFYISVVFLFARFVWDEAKYPTMSPLREIVDNIHGFVAKVEDDLKVLFYNSLVALVYSLMYCKMLDLCL